MRFLSISFMVCFLFANIECRVINCAGPFDYNVCRNWFHTCDDYSYPYTWCDDQYNHHCCCAEYQPTNEICTSPEPCHYVCCSWPQQPCGYECCNPTGIIPSISEYKSWNSNRHQKNTFANKKIEFLVLAKVVRKGTKSVGDETEVEERLW